MKSPEIIKAAASFVLAFSLTTLTACEKLTPPKNCFQAQTIYRGYTPDQAIEIFLPRSAHPETGCFILRLLQQPNYEQAARFATDSITDIPNNYSKANYTLEWDNWVPIKATFEGRDVALIRR